MEIRDVTPSEIEAARRLLEASGWTRRVSIIADAGHSTELKIAIEAIQALETFLPEEWLETLARLKALCERQSQCQLWAGSEAKAIESASEALRHDTMDFPALKMLTEIHANRNQHARAVAFIRRGLENFPTPSPPMPQLLLRALRLAMPFLPRRLGASLEYDIAVFEDPDAENRKWFAWAKEYMAWYDRTTGNNSSPPVH